MKYIRIFTFLGAAVFCFSSLAAEKTITQEDFQKILKEFEKDYNSSKTLYEFLVKIPSFSSFDYALIAEKLDLSAPPPEIKVDTVAMTVTFPSGVAFKWASPVTEDLEVDGLRYRYNPSLPLGGYLKAKKVASMDFNFLPAADAQVRKEYSYKPKEHTVFPVQKFWEAVSADYKNAALRVVDKKPETTIAAAVGSKIQETLKDAKTAARGEQEQECQQKAMAMAQALAQSHLILTDATCSSKDRVLAAGKSVASAIYDKSIDDMPDKTFTFNLLTAGRSASTVSADLDKGFFWYRDSGREYNFRFEDGKILGIAEVTTYREQEATMKDGKLTADERVVRDAKIDKFYEQKKMKRPPGQPTVGALTGIKRISFTKQCLAEIKPKPNLDPELQKQSPGSWVPVATDPYAKSKTSDRPAPIYDSSVHKICDYRAQVLQPGDKKFEELSRLGERYAAAFKYIRDARFCSDSCQPKMMPILGAAKIVPGAKPRKVEQVFGGKKVEK